MVLPNGTEGLPGFQQKNKDGTEALSLEPGTTVRVARKLSSWWFGPARSDMHSAVCTACGACTVAGQGSEVGVGTPFAVLWTLV